MSGFSLLVRRCTGFNLPTFLCDVVVPGDISPPQAGGSSAVFEVGLLMGATKDAGATGVLNLPQFGVPGISLTLGPSPVFS